MNSFEPVYKKDLLYKQVRNTLESLAFFTEKRSRDIKYHTCADGWKQCTIYNKEDTSAPKVTTESILLTAIIEGYEEQNMAIGNIPGAFLILNNQI